MTKPPNPRSTTGSRVAGSRASSRRQVVARLWRSAERQVAEIEARMARLDDDQQSLEREAKTLAIIAKTVRDLVAIDAEAAILSRSRVKGANTSNGRAVSREDDGDDRADAARDIEGFRAELARRLDELRRERGGEGSA
ncbi:MAG TPA: hypothetical protein PKW21_01990 [Rhabdaerophilum sp.]|nr:hypothetical protein [Rhabdaerophilum sp.]